MTASPSTGRTEQASPPRSWVVTVLIWFGGLGFTLALVTLPLTHRDNLTGAVVWICLGILPLYLVAVWLARRRPDHPQTRRLLLVAATFPIGVLIENAVSRWYSGPASDDWLFWVNLAGSMVNLLGTSVCLLLFATYPDGDVELAWQRVIVRFFTVLPALPVLWVLTNPAVPLDTYLADMVPTAPAVLPSPLFVPVLAPLWPTLLVLNDSILLAVGAIGVLVYRFLTAPPDQRRRMRLLTYTLTAGLPILLTLVTLRAAGVPDDTAVVRAISALFLPILLAMPVSIVIGVLRYQLFDIDVIVRRSVVYAALVILITVAYVGLAVAPGLPLGEQIPVQLAVVLTIFAGRSRTDAPGCRADRYPNAARTSHGGNRRRTCDPRRASGRRGRRAVPAHRRDLCPGPVPGRPGRPGLSAQGPARRPGRLAQGPARGARRWLGRRPHRGRLAGGRRSRAATSPLASLTPRELDVLRAMAKGHTNAGIEQSLHLSASTVEKHVNSIFGKLALADAPVHRRVAAVLTYLRSAPIG